MFRRLAGRSAVLARFDKEYLMTETTPGQPSRWTVALERTEFVSRRTFDQTLAGIRVGLGHPRFGEFSERVGAIDDWDEFRLAVEAEAGSSGLIVFLELDLGSVIARDPEATGYKIVRIITGNPVTMESMTRTTPGIGALAPVTILVFEAEDGVHVRYDTITSAIGTEISESASIVARQLDAAVLSLLAAAVDGTDSLPSQ
jgi:uncharacterized protein (DUF302 family)